MHMLKIKPSGLGKMFSHYDRTDERLTSNRDASRTHLNYNLASRYQPDNQMEFVNSRLKQVKHQNRGDLIKAFDWCVTVPKDLPAEEHRLFFEKTFDFLADKFGVENVISAYVHMDETTPHMHFCAMPIVPLREPKNGFEEKLCCKEVITKPLLNTIHTELSRHLERHMGHKVNVLNDVTQSNNLTIKELKRATIEYTRQRIENASKIDLMSVSDINDLKREIELARANERTQELMQQLTKTVERLSPAAQSEFRGIWNELEKQRVASKNKNRGMEH